MYKTDCFAYYDFGNCKALISADCEDCSFYKTKQEYKKGFDTKIIKNELEKIDCKIAYYTHLATKKDTTFKDKKLYKKKISEYKYKYENYINLLEEIKK